MTALFPVALVLLAQVEGSPAPASRDVEPALRLEGHSADVHGVAVSRDGSLIATAAFDGTARLWSAEGAEIAVLEGHKGKVLSVAFSPLGDRVATGGEDHNVQLWSLPSQAPLPIAGFESGVSSVLGPVGNAEAPERYLVVSTDQEIAVIDRQGGEPTRVEIQTGVRSIAISEGTSPRIAVACGDDRVRIASLATSSHGDSIVARLVDEHATWRFHRGRSGPGADWQSPAFDDSGWESGESGFGYSSNEEELATVRTRLDDMRGDDGYLSVALRKDFEVGDPSAIRRLTLRVLYDDGFVAWLNGDEVARRNIEGSPPAHDASAKEAGEPQDVEIDLSRSREKLVSGRNVLAIQAHNANRTSSDFVLTAVLESETSSAPSAAGTVAFTTELAGADADRVAIDRDGNTVAWLKDGDVYVAGVQNGAESRRIEGEKTTAFAFVAAGRLALARAGGRIDVIDVTDAASAPVQEIKVEGGSITALDGSGSGARLVVGMDTGTVRVIDVASGNAVAEWKAHGGPVRRAVLHASGEGATTIGSDGTIAIWRVGQDEPLGRTELAGATEASAAGEEAFVVAGGGLVRWRPSALRLLDTFSNHGAVVHDVAFSPDGRILASAGGDKRVILRELGSSSEPRTIEAHDSAVYCVDFDSRGEVFATGGYDSRVKLWKLSSGEALWTGTGHIDGVTVLRFTPDGAHLLSGGFDKTLRIWNVESGEGTVLEPQPGWVMGLSIEGSGETFLCVDFGGHVERRRTADGQVLDRFRIAPVVYDIASLPSGRGVVGGRVGSVAVYEFSASGDDAGK